MKEMPDFSKFVEWLQRLPPHVPIRMEQERRSLTCPVSKFLKDYTKYDCVAVGRDVASFVVDGEDPPTFMVTMPPPYRSAVAWVDRYTSMTPIQLMMLLRKDEATKDYFA